MALRFTNGIVLGKGDTSKTSCTLDISALATYLGFETVTINEDITAGSYTFTAPNTMLKIPGFPYYLWFTRGGASGKDRIYLYNQTNGSCFTKDSESASATANRHATVIVNDSTKEFIIILKNGTSASNPTARVIGYLLGNDNKYRVAFMNINYMANSPASNMACLYDKFGNNESCTSFMFSSSVVADQNLKGLALFYKPKLIDISSSNLVYGEFKNFVVNLFGSKNNTIPYTGYDTVSEKYFAMISYGNTSGCDFGLFDDDTMLTED